MDVIILGKRVTFVDVLTLKDGYDVLGFINNSTMDDLRTFIPLYMRMVVSWEFEGDPHLPETYDGLSLSTIAHLIAPAVTHARMLVWGGDSDLKNLPNELTSTSSGDKTS